MYYYPQAGTYSNSLSQIAHGITTVANSYIGSTNSTIQSLGHQEASVATALTEIIALIPSNVSGLPVWGGGLNVQIDKETSSRFSLDYVIGANGQSIAYFFNCVGFIAASALGTSWLIVLLAIIGGIGCAAMPWSCLIVALGIV